MSSFLRQNKVAISKIKNSLENELKRNNKNRNEDGSIYVGKCYLHVPSRVFDNYGYGMSVYTNIYLRPTEITVREYDDRLVFGLNVRKMKCIPRKHDILNNLYYYVDGSLPSDSNIAKQVKKEMGGQTLSISNSAELRNTTLYKKVSDYIDGMVEDTEVMLKDKEYPYVKDREILPLYTVNKTDGTGWYIHYSNVSSLTYRQNHSSTDMIDFNKTDSTIIASAIPSPLLRVRTVVSGSEYSVRV